MLRALLLTVFVAQMSALAESLEPIRYTLRFAAPHTHYAEVEVEVPSAGEAEVELMMAVWTPGSYLVRDYSGQVEEVTASAPGADLVVTKTRKNRWLVSGLASETFTLSYRLYCRRMTVRTNWVDRDFAMLNGAPTFITRVDAGAERAPRPHVVKLELPTEWKTSHSGLHSLDEPHTYRADDFDMLIDSPIVAGNPLVHEFEAGGKPHFLVNVGEDDAWDGPRSVADTQTIVEGFHRMWGEVPYERYSFLNMITEAGGGLEHKNSTLIMTTRWATSTRKAYIKWLGLVSHEFFHTWNVKRLRPAALGPFDYEREVYSRELWVAEGMTTYYDDLNLRRSGLVDDEEYLDLLSDQIERLQTSPGRLVQSTAEASFDAWVKLYKRDENSANSGISYYTKGAVTAFLLDARIRSLTGGRKNLDDVMRLAYSRYSGEEGFAREGFVACASEVASSDLGEWFGRALDSTEEFDYSPALEWLGLRFASGDEGEDAEPVGWLGGETELKAGRLVFSEVRRGTPAHNAGVNVDDEWIAIDDYRVATGPIGDTLKNFRPGQAAELLVSRRGKLLRLPVEFGQEPTKTWRLEISPEAAEGAAERRESWLRWE